MSLTGSDGYRDLIDCGPGMDLLLLHGEADPLDSIVDCEDVIIEPD